MNSEDVKREDVTEHPRCKAAASMVDGVLVHHDKGLYPRWCLLPEGHDGAHQARRSSWSNVAPSACSASPREATALVSRGGAEVAEKGLVSTVRWTAVGEVLPAYGRAVAIWIPALMVVVRAYRDGTAQDGEDWRVSGIEGPRVAKELVTHWAPIPNGPLPPPDQGGAA